MHCHAFRKLQRLLSVSRSLI